MHFHPAGVAYIPEGLPGDIVSGEQSNTSLVYGSEAILKLFRRLEPGPQPRRRDPRRAAAAPRTRTSPRCSGTSRSTTPTGGRPATVAMLQTLRAQRQRRLAAGDGQRARPLRRGRPARRRGGRRLRRRQRAARRGDRLGARRPGRRCCRPSRPTPTGTPPSPPQMTERLDGRDRGRPAAGRARRRAARAVRRGRRQPRARRPPARARRPAPRPGAAHRDRLDRARLRGRAGPAAGRPPGAGQPAARRRRDAAQLRLRRPAHAGRAARRPAARLPRAGVGRRATAQRSAPATPRPAGSTRAANHHSFGRSRPTRRFTSASTRHATVRTG